MLHKGVPTSPYAISLLLFLGDFRGSSPIPEKVFFSKPDLLLYPLFREKKPA
jgi:hypothetical protein